VGRALLAVAACLGVVACYALDVERCLIRCADLTHACPAGSTCLADDFCHAPDDVAMCTPIGGGDGSFTADVLFTTDGSTLDGASGSADASPDASSSADGSTGTCDYNGTCDCVNEVCPGCPDCEDVMGFCIC